MISLRAHEEEKGESEGESKVIHCPLEVKDKIGALVSEFCPFPVLEIGLKKDIPATDVPVD